MGCKAHGLSVGLGPHGLSQSGTRIVHLSVGFGDVAPTYYHQAPQAESEPDTNSLPHCGLKDSVTQSL